MSAMSAHNKIPLKKITKDEIIKRFNNLRNNYRPNFSNITYTVRNLTPTIGKLLFENDYLILINQDTDYLDYNLISDYWMELCRLNVSVNGNISPVEYYKNNYDKIKKHAIMKYKKADDYSLRESLYELSWEATSFRPTNIVAIIRRFNSKKVLDFSAGWGDRLIGAMAADVDLYVGVDPNTCVFDNYKKIISFFTDEVSVKGKYVMINSGFETAEIPYDNFDLVFTSPPYFDYEVYTSEKSQSIHNRNLKSWFNDFLMFSIKKSFNLLSVGGYMVIVINDIFKGAKYVEQMVKETTLIENIRYCGVIGYSEFKQVNNNKVLKNPQPMWVFQKK